MSPRFSVVTALYNQRDRVLQSLESVKAQTVSAHEIIVVDDEEIRIGAVPGFVRSSAMSTSSHKRILEKASHAIMGLSLHPGIGCVFWITMISGTPEN